MLDGLDAINWAELTHAYGDATDVPGLLRSLLSADSKVREETIYELFGNIWHQGTVYTASAAAVPFLYELLSAVGVEGKSDIAHLLACIASGVGYLEVHAVDGFGVTTWRKILGEEGKSLEHEMGREAAEIASVRRAFSTGLHLLIPYLRDDAAEIREAVATTLGRYPEHAYLTLPALETAETVEEDEDVREAMRASRVALSTHQS